MADFLPIIKEGCRVKNFDEFWREYPRKVGKGAARVAWSRAIKIAAPEVIMAALRAQIAAGVFRVEPTYQPHPRTWLSQERWEDEVGVDSRVMRLAEAWRLACKNGNDAAKGMVKKDAAQMGIAWRDVAAEVVRAKADF